MIVSYFPEVVYLVHGQISWNMCTPNYLLPQISSDKHPIYSFQHLPSLTSYSLRYFSSLCLCTLHAHAWTNPVVFVCAAGLKVMCTQDSARQVGRGQVGEYLCQCTEELCVTVVQLFPRIIYYHVSVSTSVSVLVYSTG